MDLKFWFVDGTRGDKLGDVVKKQQTFTYDYGGGGGTENTWYYYNKEGKLEYVDYDTPAGGQDMKFSYDGLGRRITVQRGTATVSSGQVTGFSAAETKKYVYLGGSVIRELIVVDGQDVVAKEYVRGIDLGGGIGGIIYQKKGSDYYYYHCNHKGDVVALTDGNAELAAYYEYDAWGNVMTEAEKTGVENPYRYSTKEWDEKSRLSYFGARYYSPEIGRWTQRDPAGSVDGLNLYLYAGDEPVANIDAWGLIFGCAGPRKRDITNDPQLPECVNKAKKCLPSEYAWLTPAVLRAVQCVTDEAVGGGGGVTDCETRHERGHPERPVGPTRCWIKLDLRLLRSKVAPGARKHGWTEFDEICEGYLHELRHVWQALRDRALWRGDTHENEEDAIDRGEWPYQRYRQDETTGGVRSAVS